MAPAVALAQNPPAPDREAREHFLRGVELYNEGQFAPALAEFERAYALSRNASVLFNVSAAQEGAGRFVEALASLRRYAREAPRAVVDARREDVTAGLTRLEQRVGTLVLTPRTPGLTATLDGLPQSTETLSAGLLVNAGVRRLELRAPGHVPQTVELRVTGGDRVLVEEALEPVRSAIQVLCDTPGVTVLVDGEPAGSTPLASPLRVPEGRRRVTLQRPGYEPFEREVDAVGPGARVEARLRWEDPLPEASASRLRVTASEPDVLASLDGRRIPVDGSLPVPSGPHRLRVERELFLPTERDVVLRAGAVTELQVTLVPTPAHRSELAAAARQRRTVGWGFLGPGLAVLLAGGVYLGLTGASYSETSAQFTTFDEVYRACERGAGPSVEVCQQRYSTTQRTALGTAADEDLVQVLLATGVTALGVASAVVGAVVLLSGDPRRARAPRAGLSLAPGGLLLRW